MRHAFAKSGAIFIIRLMLIFAVLVAAVRGIAADVEDVDFIYGPPEDISKSELAAGNKKAQSPPKKSEKKTVAESQRDIHMTKVRRAHLLGKTAEMSSLLREFAGKFPTDKDREYHYYRGIVLTEAREYRRAVESFLLAIDIAPDYARARNSLGALYCRLGKYQLALMHFKKALEVNPYNPFLQYNTGCLFFDIGDAKNAKTHLENAIKYKANFGGAYHRLGVLAYRAQQYESSIEHMTKAMEFKTESYTTHYYVGMSYFYLEKGGLALASLNKALRLKPDFFEAALDLARIHQSYGEFANALAFYRKADALNPDYPEIKLSIIECLYELKRYREGVALLKRMLEQDPENERYKRLLKNFQDQRLTENLAEPYDYMTY